MPPGVVPSPERRAARSRTPFDPTRPGMSIAAHCHDVPSWTSRSTSARKPVAVTTTTWRAESGTPAGGVQTAAGGAGAHAGWHDCISPAASVMPMPSDRNLTVMTVARPSPARRDPPAGRRRMRSAGRRRP